MFAAKRFTRERHAETLGYFRSFIALAYARGTRASHHNIDLHTTALQTPPHSPPLARIVKNPFFFTRPPPFYCH
jgi:hypothetical protein